MRLDGNFGGRKAYFPNSYNEWEDSKELNEKPVQVTEGIRRWDFAEDDDDYYTQPGLLFNLMTPEQQKVLFENTARNMAGVPVFIKERHIENCMKADKKYGLGIKEALDL